MFLLCTSAMTESQNEAEKSVQQKLDVEIVEQKKSETESAPKLSKKQLKRMQKHERWLSTKAERKKKEKEKRKIKLAEKAKSGVKLSSRKEIRKLLVKQADSSCKVAVVIDCDYSNYMNEMEIKKLCKQLNRCYAINKHSTAPVQLYICSITGTIKEAMDKYQSGYTNWEAHCTQKHWTEVFYDKESNTLNRNIIYLSGDSPECCEPCESIQLKNDAIFIIGGLIDHNRHKGLALERAQKFSVNHGQLPIGDHIKMTQRKILAIPHVFEIMLYASNGTIGNSWSDIFHKVIPIRKLANDSN